MAGTVTMDARERNKQIVREILDEIGRGNLEKFRSAMANDIRYSIAGSSPFSGAHTREQWWNEVVKPLGEKLDGHIGIELKTIIAEGDLVFFAIAGRGENQGRPPLQPSLCSSVAVQGRQDNRDHRVAGHGVDFADFRQAIMTACA
jgi:ketosteroid isomerase-like protein